MVVAVRGVLAGCVLILSTVCLLAAWAHRFEPVDGAARVGLLASAGAERAGLEREGGALVIHARDGRPQSASFAIPGVDGAAHLFVRYRAAARGLVPGPERWDDGRLFVEWMTDDGVAGVSRIHSARDDDESGLQSLVVSAPFAGAVPVLRFQNLGQSGGYALLELEIVPARERAVWVVGKWLAGFGMLASLALLAAGTGKPARWRGWVAAGIWMAVAAGYAFPGPWEVARPFAVPFAFGGAEGPGVRMLVVPGMDDSEPILEELPPALDPALRLRQWLPWLRPLMHVALLFGPVLAMAWFVGARRAVWLGFGLSIAIEASQVLYGFGFGWDDVMDLIVNAAGIFAAAWVHGRYARRLHARLPFPFPRPL